MATSLSRAIGHSNPCIDVNNHVDVNSNFPPMSAHLCWILESEDSCVSTMTANRREYMALPGELHSKIFTVVDLIALPQLYNVVIHLSFTLLTSVCHVDTRVTSLLNFHVNLLLQWFHTGGFSGVLWLFLPPPSHGRAGQKYNYTFVNTLYKRHKTKKIIVVFPHCQQFSPI